MLVPIEFPRGQSYIWQASGGCNRLSAARCLGKEIQLHTGVPMVGTHENNIVQYVEEFEAKF